MAARGQSLGMPAASAEQRKNAPKKRPAIVALKAQLVNTFRDARICPGIVDNQLVED